MVVGEFPWDSTQSLDSLSLLIFFIYIFIFAIFAFFILLNFFLAIVVDAFTRVKEEMEANVVENSCIYDLCDVFNETVISIYNTIVPYALRARLPIYKSRLGFPTR